MYYILKIKRMVLFCNLFNERPFQVQSSANSIDADDKHDSCIVEHIYHNNNVKT